jgi:hypothetical protein
VHTGRSEAGDYPVYELDYGGRRLAIVSPGVGAPAVAARLELMIALGCYQYWILHALADKPQGRAPLTPDIYAHVKDNLGSQVSDREKADVRLGGVQTWTNDVRQMRQGMITDGWLTNRNDGIWEITPAGRQWPKENPHLAQKPDPDDLANLEWNPVKAARKHTDELLKIVKERTAVRARTELE